MKHAKRILFNAVFAMAALLPLALHAQTDEPVYRTSVITEPQSEGYKTPAAMPAGVSRLTVYRPAYGYGTGVVGVEVNGHFHTALQIGGYSELCLPPATTKFSARLTHTGQPLKNQAEATTTVDLKQGQDAYLRVADKGNNRATFELVDASTAKSELGQTRRQTHAVSRVPNAASCKQAEAKPRAGALETITLGSDALFAFGKSDINNISAEGRADLDKLIKRLQTRYGNFETAQIQVVGHADPLGSHATNMRISQARAQSIKDYMVSGGISSAKITSEGRGDTQPVVATCPREANPQSIACNKPNRRVVISVSVAQR
jgi:OOP family OmpA-OmpF porin